MTEEFSLKGKRKAISGVGMSSFKVYYDEDIKELKQKLIEDILALAKKEQVLWCDFERFSKIIEKRFGDII